MSDDTDLRPFKEAMGLVARAGGRWLRHSGATVISAAGVGAVLLGGFVWLWRGDWGGGINPLAWNSAARASFFEAVLFGAAVGGLIGAVAIFVARKPGSP